MSYAGDFAAGATLYIRFTTRRFTTGVPYTLAGTPAVSVYKDNSATQSTAGVTLGVDHGSVTGLNLVTIDTSADGTFYANGSVFDLVITTGTIDSVSVVGEVAGRFSLGLGLQPTVAGRKLDVSAGGEAGIDWANVGSPTTVLGLSGTTVMAVTNAVLISSSFPANTAFANFTFPMVDTNDAPATGKTVTAQRSIDGAAFAACANAVTEISAGAYVIDLAAADLNGESILLKFTNADCKTRFIEIVTTPTS